MPPQPQRAPRVAGSNSKMLGVYLDGATLARVEDVAYTRQRLRNFIAASAVRLGLPLVEKLESFPEPKPSEAESKSLGLHVDGESIARVEELAARHERSRSFIAASAIRLGLPLVERKYKPLLKSKRKKTARAASKKSGAKRKAGAAAVK